MLICLASTVLATVVSIAEPAQADREAGDPGAARAAAQVSPQSSLGPLTVDRGQRPTNRVRAMPERPVCSGRYLEADPAVDAGMVYRVDAAPDAAIARRPDCTVQQRGTSEGRGTRGALAPRRTWPTLEVPRPHSPEADPGASTGTREP